MIQRFKLSAAATEGGGNPEPTPAPTPEAEGKAPDLAKAVEALVAKHGDGSAALRVLLAENFGYREQLRDAKAKLPADGSIVLAGDDAKAWDKYRGLGKPDDLGTVKREHGERGAKLANLERDGELRGVAERTGAKFAVLKTLAGALDFTGTVKVKDAKGKESEVVAVKDGDAEPVAFTDYAKAKWGDFLPSLMPDPNPAGPVIPPRRQAGPLPPVTTPAERAGATGFRMPRV